MPRTVIADRQARALWPGTMVLLALLGWASVQADDSADAFAAGRDLAFARDKGNCLACHHIADGELAGDIGPPLVNMKARYPDRQDLAAQIRDASVRNPRTTMPPFGRHRILNDEEIELIVTFLHSL